MTIGGNIDVRLCRMQIRRPSAGWGLLRPSVMDDKRDRQQPSLVRRGVFRRDWGIGLMEFLPIIGVFIAAFVAWKLLKGVIKLAVIGLLIAGAAWFFLGGLG
jgi:hypothetical protein